MPFRLGNNTISKLYKGSTGIQLLKLGASTVLETIVVTPTDATILAKTAHYWALDGGWTDLKGTANLTANGTVAIGTSLSANGTGSAEFSEASHLEASDTTKGRITDECTVMFVYQSKAPDALTNHYNLLGKTDLATGQQEWFASLNHGVVGREKIRFVYSSNGTSNLFADGAQMLTRRGKHLVTIDFSKSASTIKIAMDNGVPLTTNIAANTSLFSGSAKFAIGAIFSNGARLASSNSLTDCVLISSTPYSQAEKDYIWDGGNIRQLTAPQGTITIVSPASFQTLQRDFTTLQRSINVAGNFTVASGILDGIEVQWGNGAWVGAVVNTGAGTFTATLPNQPTEQASLRARFTNNPLVLATNQYIGVGEVFLCHGQSNMSGRGSSNQAYTPANGLKATLFGNDYVFKDLIDPYDSNAGQIDTVSSDGATGSYIPLLASYFLAQNIPVGFVPSAKGGTSTGQHLPGANIRDRTTLFGSALYRAEQAGGVRAVLWHLGETDADNSTAQATTTSNLRTIAETLQSQLACQLFAVRLQAFTSNANDGKNRARVIAAIVDAIAQSPAIETGPDLGDIISDDTYHLKTSPNLATAASRWWAHLSNFYGFPNPGVIPDLTPTGTIDITAPTAGQNFAQSASLSITGNHNFATGKITGGIRARFNGGTWSVIAPNVVLRSGAYSGSITLPAANVTGLLEVSFVDNPAIVASVSIGVGTGANDTSLQASVSINFNSTADLTLSNDTSLSATIPITFSSAADLTAGTNVDPDAQAYFSAITANGGTMSTAHQTAFDNYVKSAKASGTWAAIRAIMPFAGNNIQAAITYLKHPVGVAVNPTHTFTAARYTSAGLTGGSGFSISSGINIAALGYNLSTIGIWGWTHTAFTANSQFLIGLQNAASATNYTMLGRFSNGSREGGVIGGASSSQFAGNTINTTTGLIGINYEGSRFAKYYANGVLDTTAGTASSVTPVSAELAFMCVNVAADSSRIQHTPTRVSFLAVTEGLSASLTATFYNELSTLVAALGR